MDIVWYLFTFPNEMKIRKSGNFSIRCVVQIPFVFPPYVFLQEVTFTRHAQLEHRDLIFLFVVRKKQKSIRVSSWCGRPNGKTATQLSPLKSAKIFSLCDFCFVYFVSSFSYHFSWMYVTNNVHLVTIIAAFIVNSTHRVTRSERKIGKMKNVSQI